MNLQDLQLKKKSTAMELVRYVYLVYMTVQKDWQRKFRIVLARIFETAWQLVVWQNLANSPTVMERGERSHPLEVSSKQRLCH